MPNSKTTGKRREIRGRARRGNKTINLFKSSNAALTVYDKCRGGGDAAGLTQIREGP